MTDLLHTLPDFPTKSYTHLLPSLEKHLITTTDLLTLDALEIAKRAQLPVLDLRRLANHVIAALQADLGLREEISTENEPASLSESKKKDSLRKSGRDIVDQWSTISTLDDDLDAALGGGIPTGYITEITGESGAGKTQLLLTLLLSAQLPPPHGLSRPTLYISTEHPIPTTRLSQLLATHPVLSSSAPNREDPGRGHEPHPPPSLAHILTLLTPDLESQDHILTYQLPVALARHNVGLVVIDSVAANFRAEYGSAGGRGMAARSAELLRLGTTLRACARKYDCAVVVANQVADRFAPVASLARGGGVGARMEVALASPGAGVGKAAATGTPSPGSSAVMGLSQSSGLRKGEMDSLLALDHQQRFFTGWGARLDEGTGLKTPSLGLVWSHQIACRVALVKEAAYGFGGEAGADGGGLESAEWSVRRWRRWMRVAFAAWVGGLEGERGLEFEVWGGGVRAVGGGRGWGRRSRWGERGLL